jgi:DNA-binding GntR family transcriptional regulator
MATTVLRSPEMDGIAAEIFDLLWGAERPAIPTAVDHAYERIWRKLIAGEWRPGDRLSDLDLAAVLRVSRTPVRQALHRLAQDELVRFDPRRGFSVRAFTAQDVHEMYDVRAALEALALSLAAPRLQPADLSSQLDRLGEIRAAVDSDLVLPFLQHDFHFHNLLIRGSGNGRLVRMLATLRGQVSIFQIRDTGFPQRMEAALDGHERVLRALLAREFDEAADQLGRHIKHAKFGVLDDMFGDQVAAG